MLNSYGGKYFETKNFNRLAKKSIQFNNHYVGSMPCMPARRDMHSGRLNFLHRSWGPLEPFDNSFPEILRNNKIYSHLVTDHYHYFEDGGATYHNRFNSWDFIRGQESDPWKAMVQPPLEKFKEKFHKSQLNLNNRESGHYRYAINSEYIKEEKDFPSVKCFNSALDFLQINKDADDWFLQLETFDPHEPFFAPKRFREKFKTNYRGPRLDWPQYDRVKETDDEVAELKANYFALVGLCDYLLGKILDYFDEQKLWDNTALILTTDHGFMLGEHDWWAKNRMPVYNEIAHIPLMIYHPDFKNKAGARINSLTQTIDIMPTFLDFFGLDIPSDVSGNSLLNVLEKDNEIRKALIFGYFGSACNITDGEYTYFRYPEKMSATDLYEYTLMPTRMTSRFSIKELSEMTLSNPFKFSKGLKLLKLKPKVSDKNDPLEVQGMTFEDTNSKLFNVNSDPRQELELDEPETVRQLVHEMIDLMTKADAPKEMFKRLNLNN